MTRREDQTVPMSSEFGITFVFILAHKMLRSAFVFTSSDLRRHI